MGIDIPLSSAHSTLRCMLGIKIGCGQKQKFAIGIVPNAPARECLELISLVLDLSEFFFGVDSILEHVHLLLWTEVRCCVHKRLIKADLLLPMKDKAMRSSVLKAVSNPNRSNVGKEP